MRVKILDKDGKYMTFESLFPIQTVPNPELNEVQIVCDEWIVTEFSNKMWEAIKGPVKQTTDRE